MHYIQLCNNYMGDKLVINTKCKYCVKTFEKVKQPNGIDRDFNVMYTEVEVERYRCYNDKLEEKPMFCEGCKYGKRRLFGGIGK